VTTMHDRNPDKHEYEIERGSSSGGHMVFAGNQQETAVHMAQEALAANLTEDCFRVYHTYPSPGPMRLYIGIIKRDGLHRFV